MIVIFPPMLYIVYGTQFNHALTFPTTKIFDSHSTASEATYSATRAATQHHSPGTGMLSHYEIKKQIEEITGVTPISYDMCIDSCVAYTAHFTHLEKCPECGQPRCDPIILARSNGLTKVPRRKFDTIPLAILNGWSPALRHEAVSLLGLHLDFP